MPHLDYKKQGTVERLQAAVEVIEAAAVLGEREEHGPGLQPHPGGQGEEGGGDLHSGEDPGEVVHLGHADLVI